MLNIENKSEYTGKRLDTLCFEILKSKKIEIPSRSFLKDNWGNWLKVNNKEVKPSYKIKDLDILTINDEYIVNILNELSRNDEIIPQKGQIDIVYEDENYLVLNKDKGVVVHPGVGNYDNTLANYVRYYLESKDEFDDSVERCGIVHRLDKGVSGLIVFAKNSKAQRSLKEQFENHTVQKLYITKVCVQSLDKNFEQYYDKKHNIKECINDLIKKNFVTDDSWYKAEGYIGRDSKNRMRMTFKKYEFGGSKKSLTYIKSIGEDILLIKIETGRMHQIRATLKGLGMYIENDSLYKNSKGNEISSEIELKSIFLSFKKLDDENLSINLLNI